MGDVVAAGGEAAAGSSIWRGFANSHNASCIGNAGLPDFLASKCPPIGSQKDPPRKGKICIKPVDQSMRSDSRCREKRYLTSFPMNGF